MARKFPWSSKNVHRDDPYWDFFINTPPADLTNTVTELLRNAPSGNIFPTRTDMHTPEITAYQVKDLARYFGAAMVGITSLETSNAMSWNTSRRRARQHYAMILLPPCFPRLKRSQQTNSQPNFPHRPERLQKVNKETDSFR